MSSNEAAARRLHALGCHLAADGVSPANGAGSFVARNATSSAEYRPLPSGGKGTLTVTDSRTGKTYTIPISEGGTVAATAFQQIKAGGDGAGLKTFDPGYMNTAVCRSAISYIDGDKGILRYRGYPIEELAEHSTFPETAYLLLYGALPTASQLAAWQEALNRHTALPAPVVAAVAALPMSAHPMGCLLVGLSALSTLHPEANPAMPDAGQHVYNSRAVRDKQIVRILAKMPALAALAYHRSTGRSPGPPNPGLTFAESFLYMLDGHTMHPGSHYRPHPRLAHALDVLFVLHADHEMNCSTAAMRHLASSGVDVYTAVAGAIGALYGPLHGGANEAVLRMLVRIGSADKVPAFIEAVKAKKETLFGFGHRVYKNFDPRATIIRRLADEVFSICGRDPLIDLATALEKAARSDDYFVSRKLYPNVDFYSGLVYRALGFPPEFFTVLFALPRAAGYLAHWREQLDDPDSRIVRPQQWYTGEWLRGYTAVGDRRAASGVAPSPGGQPADALGPVPPSNATRRRLAGTDTSAA